MTSARFADLGVPSSLISVLDERGITVPTPIQAATLPDSMAGRDVLGRGRTGSGKTYAFLLPTVTRLMADRAASTRRGRSPRALVLAPTRELARQIAEALAPLAAAGGLSTVTIFGGVGQNPQVRALQGGIDVLIATPGRLEDLIGQGHADLSRIEVSVLDEADHMADLGFLPAVKRLLDRTPREGQRMLFSATLDAGVDVLAKRYLTRPVTHHADSEQSPVSTMSHHVLHIDGADRLPVLTDLASAPGRTMMFTRTKHGAKKLAKQLNGAGVPAVELHGNLSQNARVRNLDAFMSGKASTMVATDIAARGIHVDDVALVVHADPPVEHKAYLHRSGRTARAGAEGTVITIMTDDQVRDVRALTKAAGIKPQTTRAHVGHPVLTDLAPGERTLSGGLVPAGEGAAQGGGGRGNGGGRGGNGGGGRGRSTGGGARGSSAAGGGGRSGQGAGHRGQQSQGSGSSAGQGGARRSTGGGRPSTGAGGRTSTGSGGRGRSGASRGSGSVVAFSSSSQSGRR
ncbi:MULTISPECIES: DEAD/DEAH box helicase [unclassified Ornithinimicrobium]|uniref:DEAD/DEAH box helicase n=1 Tax=unclassified Ornithinimicrobium TaxID=2615080 RepID=UPI0038537064